MDELTAEHVRAALVAASARWIAIPPGVSGDPNTIDVLWLAIGLEEHGARYPLDLPEKPTGIAIVNEVERFVGATLIRFLAPEVIAARGLDLLSRLQGARLVDTEPLGQLALAFSTWHGCINMAKSLRYDTSDGTRYTEEQRVREYQELEREWRNEAARENPWVEYGVTLARTFELARGNRLNDGHVPASSPYWT